MTREELRQHDGREGRKAYVAVNGNIYDFTASKLWLDGDHQGAHQAGCDLTDALQKAPHVRAVIERFPVVDTLAESTIPEKKGGGKMALIIIAGIIILALVAILL